MILLGCLEVPGWGGAATSGYRLFKRLAADGHDVAHVALIERRDRSFFRFLFGPSCGNPDGLANAHAQVLRAPIAEDQPELDALIANLAPDVVVGRGHVAALLLSRSAPQAHSIYMTTGCASAKQAIRQGLALDYVELRRQLDRGLGLPGSQLERLAVEACDLVVTHSPAIFELYTRLFESRALKILPDVLWNPGAVDHLHDGGAGAGQPFAERDIDLLFAASAWDRREKNGEWMSAIVERCRDLTVHVAGEMPHPPAGAVHHGLITDHAEFLRLLERTRVVACCSRWDAAPDLLFEAAGRGCNVVASRNCGNWMLCPDELLVDPFTVDGFVERIRLARESHRPPRTAPFLERDSYAELVDILTVLA